MELSETQNEAVEAIKRWVANPAGEKVFRLFGYAGTGKTTVITKAVTAMGLKVAYIAYTGKAASVMRNNGIPAGTLHSLIYKFENEDPSTKKLRFSVNRESHARNVDLIVLDECSMVDRATAKDLLSFGKPVLAIGDPAQLPPVETAGGSGYFTTGEPDALLKEVHRQALKSPVLSLATSVRRGEKLALGQYGGSEVMVGADLDEERLWSADQVLVGTNKTRHRLNRRARAFFNMQGETPQFGEKLVCLKNNHSQGMMNGEMFSVLECRDSVAREWLIMDLIAIDDPEKRLIEGVPVLRSFFDGSVPTPKVHQIAGSVHMDYGYAMTVHKSQGSQWENVTIIDESKVFRGKSHHWLYTAITRASESVTMVRGEV